MALGEFDLLLVPAAWFDTLLIPHAWFDEEYIDTAAASGGLPFFMQDDINSGYLQQMAGNLQ